MCVRSWVDDDGPLHRPWRSEHWEQPGIPKAATRAVCAHRPPYVYTRLDGGIRMQICLLAMVLSFDGRSGSIRAVSEHRARRRLDCRSRCNCWQCDAVGLAPDSDDCLRVWCQLLHSSRPRIRKTRTYVRYLQLQQNPTTPFRPFVLIPALKRTPQSPS